MASAKKERRENEDRSACAAYVISIYIRLLPILFHSFAICTLLLNYDFTQVALVNPFV